MFIGLFTILNDFFIITSKNTNHVYVYIFHFFNRFINYILLHIIITYYLKFLYN